MTAPAAALQADSPTQSASAAPPTSPNLTAAPHSVPWFYSAVYLGCSWTWCIGMFLPILLLQDFGWPGFVIFAIPNILGAAAMGWVIRNPAMSRQLTDSHTVAFTAFSLATTVFNGFFAIWFVSWLSPDPNVNLVMWAIGLSTLLVLTLIARFRPSASRTSLVLALWAVSLAALAVAIWMLSCGVIPSAKPRGSLTDLAAVAAVCTLGFLACPYLDLTFHRVVARTQNHSARHRAFGVGFGAVFLSMILLTWLYAGVRTWPLWAAVAIGARAVFQAAWVAHTHFHIAPISRRWKIPFLVLGPALSLLVILSPLALPISGQTIYLLLLGMYGLVFPAYVWIVMLPHRNATSPTKPNAATLSAFLIAIVLAAPFDWLGFIVGRRPWLFVGVAIVLVARYLPLPMRPRNPAAAA